MLFPCLAVFILFLLVLAYFRTKTTKESEEKTSAFWEKENAANKTRKQDISSLDYLVLPLCDFPFGITNDIEILECENSLTELSKVKILNLSGLSNTELKLQYGAANLTELSEYDQNFALLSRTLYKYGKLLAENNHTQEAIAVFEYAISIHADLSKIYLLLGRIYQENHAEDKLEQLILSANHLSPLLKDTTVEKLKAML